MLMRALIFLIETAAGFFTVLLLLRFLMQWARAPRNPVADFVNALTNFIVRPVRRVVPGLWGLDLSTLLLAWLTQFLELVLVLTIIADPLRGTIGGPMLAGVALIALTNVLRLLLYIVIAVVILQAVLSWVNPYSPIAPLLNTLTRPFLRPLQRVIPMVANVDLSPLVVIIICQLLLIALSSIT
ncbi:MAG TPA: YggT family protein [Burkholderiales bacterium]|nr:YggT family protein [Burkholderiales bacterium]